MSSSKPSSNNDEPQAKSATPKPDETKVEVKVGTSKKTAPKKLKVTVEDTPDQTTDQAGAADQAASDPTPIDASAELSDAVEAFGDPEASLDGKPLEAESEPDVDGVGEATLVEPEPVAKATPAPRVRQPLVSPRDRVSRPSYVPHATTALAIVAVAGLVASDWSFGLSLARSQAARLVTAGDQGSGHAAELDFRLANLLDPNNQTAAARLAQLQLSSDQPDQAHATIARSTRQGEGSAMLVIDAEAELELGHASAAADDASQLAAVTANQDQLATAIVVLSATGQGSDAAALAPRVTSPQATGRVARALAGNVALAQELAASGLLRSASAILAKLPDTAPRDLLLAKIRATSHSKPDRLQAAELYQSYLAIVPTDRQTRLDYANLLDNLKQSTAATTQRNLAAKLQNQQP
jgi:hypothetical protein